MRALLAKQEEEEKEKKKKKKEKEKEQEEKEKRQREEREEVGQILATSFWDQMHGFELSLSLIV